jgi:UDP-N-acetylglucosamine--N-acetylmuramyl-(pentapeptide) pyrophosphoryl-undecaprenol N-acetylglucosamine transferase
MSSPTPERLVIACGGTGGHLFPGIAVARAAKARGWETLLLISEKQIDALATEGQEDLRFEKVPAVAMPRPLSFAMLKFLWRFWKTRRHCVKLLRDFRATAVLGMGGFTSLAPAMAGKKLKLKTFVHESNAVPGKANRMTAKFCRLVLLGLEECAQHFPAGRSKVTGTPIRPSLVPPAGAEHTALVAEARKFFDLPDEKPVILVMGGSQGARGVNNAVIAALPALASAADRVQLLHITGPLDYETVRAASAAVPALTSRVVPFCQRMELAYALAAVAVCRSGASSLTELSAWGVPSVLVPYPIAADDHQRRNAAIFTRAGAALTVEEKDIAAGQLGPLLLDLVADTEKRRALGAAMRRLAPARAADLICDIIAGE